MPLVVDASVTLSWCFADEASDLSRRSLAAATAQGVVVPLIWRYEVANVLRSGVKLKRISADDLSDVLTLLSRPQVKTADLTLLDLTGPVMALALAHNVSVYDASYLHVALSQSLPLATQDRRLREAAVSAGCELFA
jgi:predicted nucleic acid-binding protein